MFYSLFLSNIFEFSVSLTSLIGLISVKERSHRRNRPRSRGDNWGCCSWKSPWIDDVRLHVQISVKTDIKLASDILRPLNASLKFFWANILIHAESDFLYWIVHFSLHFLLKSVSDYNVPPPLLLPVPPNLPFHGNPLTFCLSLGERRLLKHKNTT